MQMLQGESIVLESDNKELTLSTHRIRHRVVSWGQEDIVSIMLEQVASCGLVHTSNPLLIVLSAVCAIAALVGPERSRVPLIFAVAILLILYFVTRKHVLAISSAGHTLKVTLGGMSTEQVMSFIEATESAKNQRFLSRGV